MSVGQVIYDYQTLITGGAALLAAYFAGRPVYRQLDLMRIQSDAVLREMLLDRQTDLTQANAALATNLGKPLNALGTAVYWDEGEGLDEEQAFYHDQNLSVPLTWLKHDYAWRDNPKAEAKRTELVTALARLIDTLDDVHRPAHTEQVDEDHNISDDDWAKFLARGEEAKGEIEARLAETQDALSATRGEIDAELTAIRLRLTKLDRTLVGEPR